LQSEAPFGIVSVSSKTASEAKTVLKNVWQNNKVEVKPVEAMFCGFIPLVEAEMSFMDGFTPEAQSRKKTVWHIFTRSSSLCKETLMITINPP